MSYLFISLILLMTIIALLVLALYLQASGDHIPSEGYTNQFKGDWVGAHCKAYGVNDPLKLISKDGE